MKKRDGRRRRALLIGINKASSGVYATNALQGCVHDVEGMYSLLVNTLGWNPNDIRVLTDERATTPAIIERLAWLVTDAEVAVFHFSGHGTQVRDRHGDELVDGLDECIVPVDFSWDDPFTDDKLAALLRPLRPGVEFSIVLDSCHSGTMLRHASEATRKARGITPPFDIRCRTSGARFQAPRRFGSRLAGQGKALLFSACTAKQTAADAWIAGVQEFHGAHTWALQLALTSNGGTGITSPLTVRRWMHGWLTKNGYQQDPQVQGPLGLQRLPIFGGKV